MSVLLAVPTYETVSTETYKALWELDGAGHDLMFDPVKGYDCALARIKMCEAAISYGADYLLMVDSDTVPPPDALANMLEHGVDFCLGYYQHGHAAKGSTALWKKGSWAERYTIAELRKMRKSPLIEVQGGGMGCALIRVDMLQRLPKPWFRWVVRPDGTETGEDVYFCDLCRKHGVKVYADARVRCKHGITHYE